jgi:hypothetical protein
VVGEVMRFREGAKPRFTQEAISQQIARGGPLLDAINRAVKASKGKIEKVGFARAIAQLCANRQNAEEALAADLDLFLGRMRVLFRALNKARRQAEREAGSQRLETLVDQRARLFQMDHPDHATLEQARLVLDDIEAHLNLSVEADAIRNDMMALRRALEGEPDDPVADYRPFLEGLIGLKHAHRRWVQAATRPPEPEAAPTPAAVAFADPELPQETQAE